MLDDYMKLGLFPPSLLSGENVFADQYNDELNLNSSELEEDTSLVEEEENT